MDLLLSEEQEMLRGSAAGFARRHGGAGRLRGGGGGLRAEAWAEAARAGLLDILLPEGRGGSGLGLAELCLVAEQCGRLLVPEPVCAAAVAWNAVARGGGARPPAGAPAAVVVPALVEAPHDLSCRRTTAVADGGGLRVDGEKTGVAGAGGADTLLVSALAPDGPVLAAVAGAEAEVAPARAADGTEAAAVRLAGARARPVARGAPAVASVLAQLSLATAAELVGVMDAAREATLGHLRERRQFGRPIGSFQALRHAAVDDLAAAEASRALVWRAARAVDAGADPAAPAAAALSHAAGRALAVCKSAVQMHGAAGFSDAHDIGYHLKRALVLAVRWGDAAAHRRRFIEASGPGGPGPDQDPADHA